MLCPPIQLTVCKDEEIMSPRKQKEKSNVEFTMSPQEN